MIENLSVKDRNAIINQYKIALRNIRAQLMKMEEKEKKDTYAYLQKKQLAKAIEEQINRELEIANEKVKQSVSGMQSDAYKEKRRRTLYEIDKDTKFEFGMDRGSTFALIPVEAISKLQSDDTFLSSVSDMNKRTKAKVKVEIQQGLIQGKSYADISKGIKEALNENANRAMLIARTETHKAMEFGSLSATDYALENGVKLTKVWVATKDDRTRDTHAEMDGKEADFEGDNGVMYFEFPDGTLAEAPGLSGVAAEDINCRCTYTNRVDGYEPQAMRVRNSDGENEVIPYMTFKEWDAKYYNEWKSKNYNNE